MNTQIVRHGEAILKPCELPKEAILKEELDRVVVAHSETGHHHVLVKDKIDLSKYKVYTHNGDTYVEVPSLSKLIHEKTGSDVHKTHTIAPSVYKIIIKNEFDYFSGAIRRVRD